LPYVENGQMALRPRFSLKMLFLLVAAGMTLAASLMPITPTRAITAPLLGLL